MSNDLWSTIGMQIKFADGLPATNAKAGFEALTPWIEGEYISEYPMVEATNDVNTADLLDKGYEQAFIGITRFADTNVTFVKTLNSDAADLLYDAAYVNKRPISMGIFHPNGVDLVEYVQVIVTKFSNDNTDVAKSMATVRPIAPSVEATKPV